MELMESVSVLGDYRNTSLIMTITRQPQMKKKKKKKHDSDNNFIYLLYENNSQKYKS